MSGYYFFIETLDFTNFNVDFTATMGLTNINIAPDEVLRCFVSQTSTFPPRVMHPTRDRTLRSAWVGFIGGAAVPELETRCIVKERTGFVSECECYVYCHL